MFHKFLSKSKWVRYCILVTSQKCFGRNTNCWQNRSKWQIIIDDVFVNFAKSLHYIGPSSSWFQITFCFLWLLDATSFWKYCSCLSGKFKIRSFCKLIFSYSHTSFRSFLFFRNNLFVNNHNRITLIRFLDNNILIFR